MVKSTVAVLMVLVLLTATVVLAEEKKSPPTAGQLVQKIDQITKQIEQLKQKISELEELRTRVQGAYQYAIALQEYAKTQTNMTCSDGTEGSGECSEMEP